MQEDKQEAISGRNSSIRERQSVGFEDYENQIQQVSVFENGLKEVSQKEIKPPKNKRIVYTAKRLNFKHGHLDIRGMEQKLQRFAYKHADCDTYFDSEETKSIQKK